MASYEATNTAEADDEEQPRRYRGGFSSSICDGLFAHHDTRHSDCCALSCCGILLYDRNAYLLNDERPSWKGRCCNALILCLVLAATVLVVLLRFALVHPELAPDNDGSSSGKEARTMAPEEISFAKFLGKVETVLIVLFLGLCFYYLYSAASHRLQLRRVLMTKMYDERGPYDQPNNDQTATATTPLVGNNLQTFLQAEESYTNRATAICGCIHVDGPAVDSTASDMCYWMWKAVASMCCGACCNCWCQCCGICAMAQEDRELQRMLPKSKFQIDFITFEPFEEYFPKLQALRDARDSSPLAHMQALSLLSRNLIRVFLVVLAILAVIAFSGLDPLFQPPNLLVVGLVFLQAFLIITIVHWLWNRFDLSFDAIVKFFASGFVLGTTNALVFESMVSYVLTAVGSILAYVWLFFVVLTGSVDSIDDDDDDSSATSFFNIGGVGSSSSSSLTAVLNFYATKAVSKEDPTQEAPELPVWLAVIMAFLNAFVVAALVEEIVKYFGFWMVEHPDLIVQDDSVDNDERNCITNGDTAGGAQNGASTSSSATSRRSMKSLGAGITVAMISVAMGFACCENFLYVFFYSGPTGAASEAATLIIRSLFPVHPLAAAIQSIGVVRRDLEKDASVGFGTILLPALLLHGVFDFTLMFIGLLVQDPQSSTSEGSTFVANWIPASTLDGWRYQEVPKEPGNPLDEPSETVEAANLAGMICSVGTVFIGFVYYFVLAHAQRKRLLELDNNNGYEQLA